MSVLDDGDANWKDFALSEYYTHKMASGFTMYREGRFKYVYLTRYDADHGQEELYDMWEDFEKFENLDDCEKYQENSRNSMEI